jgi:hypothetical protein
MQDFSLQSFALSLRLRLLILLSGDQTLSQICGKVPKRKSKKNMKWNFAPKFRGDIRLRCGINWLRAGEEVAGASQGVSEHA